MDVCRVNSSAPYYGIINTELTVTSGEVEHAGVNLHALSERGREEANELMVEAPAS